MIFGEKLNFVYFMYFEAEKFANLDFSYKIIYKTITIITKTVFMVKVNQNNCRKVFNDFFL